ncbi:CapA family protein [Streptomyces sp. DvalAA-14]|uniref:CapA family protein n=1 Tax=Streptomyces sp. SID4948 TaxID=2690287 RepID=UPI00210D9A1F|nr:CapA family protein [Streptomyces sp. DvalAA-14]
MKRSSNRSWRVLGATLLALALSTAAGCTGKATASGSPGAGGAGEPSFTVAAAGDILIHPQLTEQGMLDARRDHVKGPYFDDLMAGVKPVISKADLAICHLEPVLGKPAGPWSSYPDFVVPPQIATTIKDIGYDTCSTDSNHSLDDGYAGVKRTLDALDKAGVKHTGSARTKKEHDTPNIIDVKGVKVAQISFAFGYNTHDLPKNQPWLVNKTSLGAIKAAEKRARAAGAEVVILSIHWGQEDWSNPSRSQLELARQIATQTHINLVIGHHAHVVQPMEKINGTWIAYSLGNQVARHDVPIGITEEGVIGWFTFTKHNGAWTVRAQYVPTFVDLPPDTDDPVVGSGSDAGQPPPSTPDPLDTDSIVPPVRDTRLVDIARSLRDDKTLTADQRARYRLAFERTRGTLLNRGAEKDGLTPLLDLPD